MSAPTVRPGILDIEPYRGGNAGLGGDGEVIMLAANESPLGPSPRAVAALEAAAPTAHRYPDGGATALRQALARHHDLAPDRIVCGNGSDELISLLVQAYAGPGDEVLYSRHGFLMYGLAARATGATPVTAPETDLTADIDHLLAAVTARTRIVFVANPNNPTGSYLTTDQVARLRAGLAPETILVIDAAYAEYVSRNDYTDGLEFARGPGNTVMTRTFSKLHGLAGLRVGWAYGPAHVIDVLNRVRGPFNVNGGAQAAALAALGDTAHADAARTHNDIWLPKLSAALRELGLDIPPSVGNFVLVRFPGGGDQAQAAADFLLTRRIIVRGMAGYGLADALRITVGTGSENQAVLAALGDFLAVR